MAPIPEPSNASRAAADQGRVVGVQNGGGSGFVRMEIDDFCQSWPRLNLYLQAMEQLQDNRSTTRNIHTDWWCWWQIQGIHGKPWAQWRGIGSTALYTAIAGSGVSRVRHQAFPRPHPKAGNPEAGYCTHGSVLFPTWHRAYEAMIEQALQATMTEIALQFPRAEAPGVDRALVRLGQSSRAAAVAFRQPYWDPFRARAGTAAGGNLVPGLSLIFAVKKVLVTRPTGVKETIDNPLYSYKYPDRSLLEAVPPAIPPDAAFDIPGIVFRIPVADQWAGHDKRLQQTTRRPPRVNSIQSRNIDIQRKLENDTEGQLTRDKGTNIRVAWWRDLMEKAYHTLMIDLPEPHQTKKSPAAYHRFATTEWFVSEESARKGIPVPARDRRTKRDPMSLENWHDWIHAHVGGGFGTMGDPSTAGHDPIFIFHHANIDRHFALYQALHPEIWFGAEEMTATVDTFTVRANTFENPQTPLMPFIAPAPTQFPPPSHPYWTSNRLRDHSVLGYEYEPIHSSLDKDVRRANATLEVNRTLNWWSTGTSSDSSLNPVPMDKVEAFVSQPPLIDDLTSPTSLWTVTTAIGQPAPTPAPPAGPGPTPLRFVTPLAHQEAAQEPVRLNLKKVMGESIMVDPKESEHSSLSSEGASGTTSLEESPLNPTTEPPHTTLPDSDYKFIFPPHTIDSAGRVPLWFFNFRSERHCLGGSFTVYVFLGDFSPDHTHWSDDENALAPLFQFINHNPGAFETVQTADDDDDDQADSDSTDSTQPPKKGTILRLKPPSDRTPSDSCANCADQQLRGTHLANTAPLTQNLIRYIHHDGAVPKRSPQQPLRDNDLLPPVELTSLELEDVVPFLQRNLHWRIVRADGTQVPRDELPSFRAFVTRRYMTLPKRQTDWPVYEDAELIWEVTDGRMGGLEDGELP